MELSGGYQLVNVSNPRFPETDAWSILDPADQKVGRVSVYVTGYATGPAIAEIFLDDSVRGTGLGGEAVVALKRYYGSLSSDPQGNTTSAAIKMWQRLGAKQLPTNKNTKGYFFILD